MLAAALPPEANEAVLDRHLPCLFQRSHLLLGDRQAVLQNHKLRRGVFPSDIQERQDDSESLQTREQYGGWQGRFNPAQTLLQEQE